MKSVVVAPGEGRFITVGSTGAGVTVKASEAETGGLCTVWEGRIPPGAETEKNVRPLLLAST